MYKPCVALDCEMVGVGKNWRQDGIGRVAVVDESGNVLLDKYVRPLRAVTDYRTPISGITKAHLDRGDDFETTKASILQLLHGKILVGHALESDFSVLDITHPEEDVRDTAYYFEHVSGKHVEQTTRPGRTPALKFLARVYFGTHIQNRAHSPVEDARTAMKLYKRFQSEWETKIETGAFQF